MLDIVAFAAVHPKAGSPHLIRHVADADPGLRAAASRMVNYYLQLFLPNPERPLVAIE
jgi:hypothetical protein